MKKKVAITNKGAVVSPEANFAMNVSKALMRGLWSSKGLDWKEIQTNAKKWTCEESIEVEWDNLLNNLSYHALILGFIRKAEELDIIGLQNVVRQYREELKAARLDAVMAIGLLNEIAQSGELPTY